MNGIRYVFEDFFEYIVIEVNMFFLIEKQLKTQDHFDWLIQKV